METREFLASFVGAVVISSPLIALAIWAFFLSRRRAEHELPPTEVRCDPAPRDHTPVMGGS